MKFPQNHHPDIAGYFHAYASQISAAFNSVDRNNLAAANELLNNALQRDAHIFSCGNGGSAAISNHLICDHTKGVAADTGLRPRVFSLSTTVESITAIANDIEYAQIFSEQLRYLSRPGDVLIAISSSGSSQNIINALQWAKNNGVQTLALTGFDGGVTKQIADVSLHVDNHNYGIVEDVHQSLMHVLAQFIRQYRMPGDLIKIRRF